MKKVIVAIVIIGAVALIYAMRNGSATTSSAPTANEKGVFRPDPSGATFTFDDEPVTLSAGRNETAITPGSALVEETVLLDQLAYGDVNADGKEDTALLLARYGGGSGTFIYLAAFVSGPVTYHGSEAIFIGDRIAPKSISISGGIVTVKYLDRKDGDAFATEPTVSVSKQFIYRAGVFEER